MLDLSRIDDHRLILKVSEVNAIDHIKDILFSITHAAEQQEIAIEFSPSDSSIPLFLDQDRFESIILNILSNALKYSAAGDRISIRTGRFGVDRVYIEIEDTGEGIEPEDLPHIFERYHHNDAKSHSSQKGVGVGLSLCKSLVELHGGTIAVKSKPGVGTTFTIQFQSGREHLDGRDDIIFSRADTLKPLAATIASISPKLAPAATPEMASQTTSPLTKEVLLDHIETETTSFS